MRAILLGILLASACFLTGAGTYLAWQAGYFGATVAAWVQALLSAGAIFVSVWLQDRDRRKRARIDKQNQLFALHAITERCIRTVRLLTKRAHDASFKGGDFNWLMDEVRADEETVSNIDLMQLSRQDVIWEVTKLCTAMRRARRRLGYAENRIKSGEGTRADEFDSSYEEAAAVFAAFSNMLGNESPTDAPVA